MSCVYFSGWLEAYVHRCTCGVSNAVLWSKYGCSSPDKRRKACVHDAVLPWSIIAGRSLDTRCRHPRYEETSDELGRVPISGQRVSPDQAATPPRPLMAGQHSYTRPSDQTPGHRGRSQGNGQGCGRGLFAQYRVHPDTQRGHSVKTLWPPLRYLTLSGRDHHDRTRRQGQSDRQERSLLRMA